MCTTTDLSCSSCCLILELRFLTTGRPVTVAARKLVAELGCRVNGLYWLCWIGYIHSQRYFKMKCNSCFLNHQSKLRFLRVKLLKGKLLGEWAAGGFWVLSSLNESFWDWPLGRSSLARNIITLRSSVTCTSSFPIVQTSTQEPFWLQQCQFGYTFWSFHLF